MLAVEWSSTGIALIFSYLVHALGQRCQVATWMLQPASVIPVARGCRHTLFRPAVPPTSPPMMQRVSSLWGLLDGAAPLLNAAARVLQCRADPYRRWSPPRACCQLASSWGWLGKHQAVDAALAVALCQKWAQRTGRQQEAADVAKVRLLPAPGEPPRTQTGHAPQSRKNPPGMHHYAGAAQHLACFRRSGSHLGPFSFAWCSPISGSFWVHPAAIGPFCCTKLRTWRWQLVGVWLLAALLALISSEH